MKPLFQHKSCTLEIDWFISEHYLSETTLAYLLCGTTTLSEDRLFEVVIDKWNSEPLEKNFKLWLAKASPFSVNGEISGFTVLLFIV